MNWSMLVIAVICLIAALGCMKLMAMSELSTKLSPMRNEFEQDLSRAEVRNGDAYWTLARAHTFADSIPATVIFTIMSPKKLETRRRRAEQLISELQAIHWKRLTVDQARDKEQLIGRLMTRVNQIDERLAEIRSEVRIWPKTEQAWDLVDRVSKVKLRTLDIGTVEFTMFKAKQISEELRRRLDEADQRDLINVKQAQDALASLTGIMEKLEARVYELRAEARSA